MRRRLQEAQDANRERGKKTREKILLLIAESEPAGMSTADLRKATGLHRDRIHVICKGHMDKKLLDKTGRFGKYHLGHKAFDDPSLAAFIFENKTMKKFHTLVKIPLYMSIKFCDHKLCEDIHDKELPKEEDSGVIASSTSEFDQLQLFEYALRLGALITYELLQCIRYGQKQPSYLTGPMKNDLMIKWLDNVIRPVSLIQSFSKLLPVHLRLKPEYGSEQEEKGNTLSWLDLQDETKFNELEDIFRSTFPDLFEDLENIRRTKIPDEINLRLRRLKEASKRERQEKGNLSHG